MTSVSSPPPPRQAPSDPLGGTASPRRPERGEGPVELQKDHRQSGLAMIAAVDRHGAIGRANQMPWRLPDDLQRFKALTLGHHVIMGRKTFESIGRPLPGRTNVIITRQPGFAVPSAQVAHSLDDALALCA